MSNKISQEELEELMSSLGFKPNHLDWYREQINAGMASLELLDQIPLPESGEPSNRTWAVPEKSDNPYNAWSVKTHIPGAESGRLKDKTVAIKDNVMISGVPLNNGTRVLDGFIADEDAEIVTRLLNAGATILGKTVCEAYCFSGGSHTSDSGPVRNPRAISKSAGGSSSGSAVVVATEEVDMAIGCDQGGSIRMPSSFTGIVGMKPTHGLVPYTGILGMTPLIDHTGPMTRTVKDNALMLEVLAGPDGVDFRQKPHEQESYSEMLGRESLKGISIGVVSEGFDTPFSEEEVGETVDSAINQLRGLGATIVRLSIPLHSTAGLITMGGLQASFASMFLLDGCAIEAMDSVSPAYLDAQRKWRDNPDWLTPNVKSYMLQSEWMRRHHGYRYVSESKKRIPMLREAYDKALREVDVLVMPTTPMKATSLPDSDASPEEITSLSFQPTTNTSPFNSTHHPALSIPCGMVDGLPIGMMLIGKHYDESTLYQIGDLFERKFDWQDQ